LFVGLFLSNPTNTGAAGTELSYSGYARQPITFSEPSATTLPSIQVQGGLSIHNTETITWESAPSAAGTVRFIGIFDSAVGGNMLLYGELAVPLAIGSDQQPSILGQDIIYFAIGDSSLLFKTQILNLLRGETMPGSTPHLALFSGDPENAGVELSGPSYARATATFGAPAVQVGGQSQIANTNFIQFPIPLAAWGNWAWDGVMSAATGGVLLFKFQNPNPEIVHRNYVPQVHIGEYRLEVN